MKFEEPTAHCPQEWRFSYINNKICIIFWYFYRQRVKYIAVCRNNLQTNFKSNFCQNINGNKTSFTTV